MRFVWTYLLVLTISAQVSGQVILVKPQTSAAIVAPDDPNKQVESWIANLLILLREAGGNPVVENELFVNSNESRSTILLFNAECLSDTLIKALQEHVDQGGNLWITGATGYRNETGAVRGWVFLRSLLGGDFQLLNTHAGAPVSLHLKYGKPGTSSVPPGYRWRLALDGRQILATPESESDIAGYWAGEKYIEGPADSISRHTGFLAKTTLSGGRIVWMGAGLEGIHLDPVNREMTLKIFSELIGWLNGNGIPSVEAWPNGNKSAVLIHGDIEDKFDAVGRLTDVFKRQNVPVTYKILVNEAERFPKAIDKILETKAELSVHGDNHALFAGQPLATQIERLQRAAGFISLYGKPPVSFRPPELAYDLNTLSALKTAGYSNFLAYDKPDRDYPIYIVDERSPEAGIVFFPKGELDDYDLAVNVTANTTEIKKKNLISDFNRIYSVHGLYKLNFHSQYLTTSELPQAVEGTIVEIKSHDDVWFAQAREISDWIRLRSRLLIQSNSTNSTITVTLTNTSAAATREVVLRVLPPQNVPAELLTPRHVSHNCQYDVRDDALFVSLPTLKPGEMFKMDLSAGSGRALNDANKKILINSVKAFVAIAAIVILWFVMYLAFSGKKIKRGSSIKLAPITEQEENWYKKQGFNLKPVDLKELHNGHSSDKTNSSAEQSKRDFVQSDFIQTAVFRPMVSNAPMRNSSAAPPVEYPITTSSINGKPGNFPAERGIRYERSTKIPSVPMVMKPLTAVERDNPKPSTIDRKAKQKADVVDMQQSAKVTKNATPILVSKDRQPPSSDSRTAVGGNQTTFPTQTRSIVNQSNTPGPLQKPRSNPTAGTFKSPSGLRTTAILPKTASSQSHSQRRGFQIPDAEEAPDTAVSNSSVRTSIEILRSKHQVSGGSEDWR